MREVIAGDALQRGNAVVTARDVAFDGIEGARALVHHRENFHFRRNGIHTLAGTWDLFAARPA